MPRQVNMTVCGVNTVGTPSFCVVQYGARSGNSNVSVTQGECHPAMFAEQVRMIAEWHEARVLAVTAIGMRTTKTCIEIDRTLTDDPWAAVVPGVRVVYVPHARAVAMWKCEVAETLGRLQYSTGSKRTAWDIWKDQPPRSIVSQATAVGAAIVCAGWVVGQGAEESKGAGQRQRHRNTGTNKAPSRR